MKAEGEKFRLWLRSFVNGEKCAACGKPDTKGQSVLCPACLGLLREKAEEHCSLCGLPARSCLCMPPSLEEAGGKSLIKLGFYDPVNSAAPLNKSILRLKDNRDRMLCRLLLSYMRETFEAEAERYGLTEENCIVTYIPRSNSKIRQTGTDQARLIARELAAVSGFQCWQAIARTKKKTASQKSLKALGRSSNVRGMFYIPNTSLVFGKNVILADDLVTTGATMAECVRLLEDCGALSVICLCIGRTSVR